MAFSGIILYITPKGRIANWINWQFMGIAKEGWEGIHNIVAILFFFGIGLHIYYNWKVLIHYLKDKVSRQIGIKKEFVASLVVIGIFVTGAIGEFQPFWSVMDLNESIKAYWDKTSNNPPVPHAEDLTLAELSEITGKGSETIIKEFKKNNITLSTEGAKLSEIAEANNTTPDVIYSFFGMKSNITISESHAISAYTGGGAGYSQMTIQDLSKNNNLDINVVLETLKKKNIEAKPDENLRSIAERNDLRPYDLAKIIIGDK